MESAENQQCPSCEELSEYFDALQGKQEMQEERKAVIAAHVKTCGQCRKSLEAYSLLDRLVADSLKAPDGLEEQVMAACRHEARRLRLFAMLRATAAGVVLLGIIGLYWTAAREHGAANERQPVTVAVSQEKQEDASVSTVPEPQALPTVAENAVNASENTGTPAVHDELAQAESDPLDSAVRGYAVPSGRRVSNRDVRPVAVESVRFSRQGNSALQKQVPDAVRHIWMVDDLSQSRTSLELLVKNYGAKVNVPKGEKTGMIAVVQGMTDRQLQTFVEQLAQDWALVSPMYPQPGQAEHTAFRNKPVTYTLWIMEKSAEH